MTHPPTLPFQYVLRIASSTTSFVQLHTLHSLLKISSQFLAMIVPYFVLFTPYWIWFNSVLKFLCRMPIQGHIFMNTFSFNSNGIFYLSTTELRPNTFHSSSVRFFTSGRNHPDTYLSSSSVLSSTIMFALSRKC